MLAEIRVLSRSDLRALMRFGDYVEAVTEAFCVLAEGRCMSPVALEMRQQDGTFHIKAGTLPRGTGYVAVKINGNFPLNNARHGLPTIQGAVYLADASDGRPLAVLDSAEVTLQRTGAATAVAARYLARKESTTATICGCGEQGGVQLVALRHVLNLRSAFAWDADAEVARAFARRMTIETGISVQAVHELGEATRVSDAIVTCTTSRQPYLGIEQVRPGTFIAAVGADSPDKSELTPPLMGRATVVVDVLEQALSMGDLNHAVAAGVMRSADVHADLGQLVTGEKAGRCHSDEITIFDSTGTGVQDVAAASCAYELALKRGVGHVFKLS
jgi:alanine dehydrogenase